jgi:uncharacterized repeat protein (TIGR02543 family)
LPSKTVTYAAIVGALPGDVDGGFEPTRTGYTLGGWATSAALSAPNFDKDTTYMTPSNTTLYAIWNANTYEVSFDGNAGSDTVTIAPLMTTFSAVYDSGYGTPANATAARTGYNFLGWWTTSAAIGGDKVTSAAIVKTPGDHTIYAHWSAKTYKLNFNANSGTNGTTTQMDVTYNAAVGTLPTTNAGAPTRTGYIFAGWSTASGSSNTLDYNPTTYLTAGDTTVYAVWTAKTNITLNFNENGGTGAPASQTVTYGSPAGTLPGVGTGAPTRTDYVFQGWSKNSGATTPDFTENYVVDFDPDLTVYAVWAANTRTITYHSSGHTAGAVPAQTTHTLGSAATLSDKGTLARTHYSFEGWSTNASANAVTNAAGATVTVDSDMNFYAVWKEDAKYTVTYNANGGTGAPSDSSTYYSGDNVTVKAANGLTRNGYTFQGWAESANGAVKYSAGDKFNIANSNITLYAVWQENEQPEEPAAPVEPTTPPTTPTGPTEGPGAGTPATTTPYTPNPGTGATTTVASDTTSTTSTDNTVVSSPETNNAETRAAGSPLALLSGNGEIVSQEELRDLAREAGVPLVGIGENAIPLVGIEGYAFWSLVDLAIVLFAIVVATWNILTYRRRRDQSELAEVSGSSVNLRPLFIAILAMTIVNAALFLLTQDFAATPLVMVDVWTIPTTALVIAECLIGRVASKRIKASYGEGEGVGDAIDIRNA